jgi:inosine-uridine nucleoside N-ribohydrolase
MPVAVETQGQYTCGMTVQSGENPNAEVSTDIRADEVRALYLETISQGKTAPETVI